MQRTFDELVAQADVSRAEAVSPKPVMREP
jgi:hypothetical protein